MQKKFLFKSYITLVFCMFYQFVSAQTQYDNLVKVVQVIKADCNSNKGSIVIERMATCEITLWYSYDNTVKTIFQKTFNSWQLRDTIKDLDLGNYSLSSKSDFYTDQDVFKMESYLNLKIQASNKNIICGNSGTILVAPLAQKYLWSTGETTQMITVKNPGKVKLTITEPSEKVCSLTDSIDLKLNPQINIDVLLSKSSCNADSTLVQYKISGGKKPYKMKYSPNQVCFEGCAMPTDTAKYLKYWSSGYTLYLTDSLGCYTKKEFYLRPNSSELKLAYKKTTSLCEGDSVVFNDKFPNDVKYTHEWYKNGSLLSEAKTNNFSTKQEGSYHVVIKSQDCVIYSDTNKVEVIKRTPLECSVSENANCLGVPITYEAPAGKSYYDWRFVDLKFNVDYLILEGGSYFSNKLVVKWLSPGEKKFSLNYTEQCPDRSELLLKANVKSPDELIHVTPEKSDVCLNSIVTYKVKNLNASNSINNIQNLIWTVSGDPNKDYKVLEGGKETDSSITVQWLKPSKTGIIVNPNDCGKSLSFDVTVYDTINFKKLVADLPLNLCKVDSIKLAISNLTHNTIQWYFNDQEITKAIDSVYYAKQPGKYNVVIKNAVNCSFKSDYFEFKKDTCSYVAKLNDIQGDYITVYPNPASTLLNIDLNNSNVKSVALINVLGQKVIHQDLRMINNVINVQDIVRGMYMVSFFNEQNEIIFSKKISIQ